MRFGAAVAALMLLPLLCEARIFKAKKNSRGSSLSTRRRLSISPLIAAPGTFELDVTGAFSTSGDYTTPATLRYTPVSDNFYLGHTEWGINADFIDGLTVDGQKITHASDHVTLQSTTAAKWGAVNLALAPQMTMLTRGADGGLRGGATAIGVTLGWTGATQASDTNPAGIWDIGFGFGRKLGSKGVRGNFTPHINATIEKQTGAERFYTLLEGVEYQFTDRFSLDISGQHIGMGTGVVDHQVLIGMTFTLGPAK